MLTSDYINSIELTDEERNYLIDTYIGLDILDKKIGNAVAMDGTALSAAMSGVNILKCVLLTMTKNKTDNAK